MARFWTIAILTLLAPCAGLAQAGGKTADKDVQIKEMLTKDDPVDAQRNGPFKVHLVRLKKGKSYAIDMVSTMFDSYLRLQDDKGVQIDEDDDSGGNLNARIIFNCARDGEYKIVCTTFAASPGGNYTLTVKTMGGVQLPSTAHALMIGKDAPVFQADFAVNGKADGLSDLEGKVVLLYFWEVRSASSLDGLARLSEWSKKNKVKGLEVVGVTFYASDIDQKLGFDKTEGKIVRVKEADRKSDQTLLRAFAAHRKIDHLLLALSKEESLDAFNAYAVNSVPQLVLIDRKGRVRMIDVSGGKNAANVESEIAKLLEEK